MKPVQRPARFRALWWAAMARTASAIAGPRHPVSVAAVERAHAALDAVHLCLDCRFAEIEPLQTWHCLHPSSLYQPPRDVVTGRTPEPYRLTCESARTMTLKGDLCGLAGRHWAPRCPAEQGALSHLKSNDMTQ